MLAHKQTLKIHLWKLIYVPIVFRHILAILHFNCNLQRDVEKDKDNTEKVKITYPKFKNGEATVRQRRVKQNFGKFLKK